MKPGIILLIVGGIFAFALKTDSPWLDLQLVGVILMLGGVGFIVRSRVRRTEVVTEEDNKGGTEEATVVERRVE
jgi:hypothetical protein